MPTDACQFFYEVRVLSHNGAPGTGRLLRILLLRFGGLPGDPA